MFFGGAEYILVAVVVFLLGGAGLLISGGTLAAVQEEVDRWIEGGVVSREQGADLRDRHTRSWVDARRRRMVAALAVLGGVIVGLGVILFFAANWGEIPRFVRLAILIAGMAVFYGVAYVLRERRERRYPNVGHAFAFLGVVLFGASLFLVDQMYHLQADEQWAFLWWSLAAVAVGLLVRSAPLAGLGILTFLTWYGAQIVERDEDVGTTATGAGLLGFYGIALYALGTGFADRLGRVRFATAMRMLGFTLGMIAVFVLTFEFAYEVFGDEGERPSGLPLATLLVLAAASLAGAVAVARRRERTTRLAEGAALTATVTLVLLAALMPQVVDEEAAFEGRSPTFWHAILFNVLMAALALGAVVAGTYNDEAWLANGGLTFAIMLVIARFVDGSWTQLWSSVVFVLAGALVLALAWQLERRRPREAFTE